MFLFCLFDLTHNDLFHIRPICSEWICLYMIPIISMTFDLDRHIEVTFNADADCYAKYTLNIGHTFRACCALLWFGTVEFTHIPEDC